jgi:CheY-like chemotaxis protein
MQYLVVTHAALMEEVFRRILTEMGAAVEFRGHAKSGRAALEERRFDVVAIDYDDVYQAAGLLRAAHLSRPNKSSVLLAITNGETSAADAVDMGAQLVAAKPLPPDRARYELRRASQALASGQRRQRYPVRLPVFLSCGQVLDRRAEACNVSLGGIGLRLRDPMDADELVHVRFWIPECATSIQARGEIAWSDLEGNAGPPLHRHERGLPRRSYSVAAAPRHHHRLPVLPPARLLRLSASALPLPWPVLI